MRGVQLSDLHCSVARTLDIVGERWTLLILRDAFNGKRRFEEFARSPPIARNVLTGRLQTLVEHDIFERVRYQERPDRFEYRMTSAGRELYPVMIGRGHAGRPAPRWSRRPTARRVASRLWRAPGCDSRLLGLWRGYATARLDGGVPPHCPDALTR